MVAHHLGGTFRVSSRNELHEGKMLASLAIERLLVPAPLQGKSWHAHRAVMCSHARASPGQLWTGGLSTNINRTPQTAKAQDATNFNRTPHEF